MTSERAQYLIVVLLVCIFVSGMGLAVAFNTDFGGVEVKSVSVPDGQFALSGLLYRSVSATATSPQPAVVVVHGISSNKQMMSCIALELARRGFVALALDLVGHGNSEGQLRTSTDPTLGTLAGIRYLEGQSFVKVSLIGLVGHSLGAGAVRAAAVAHGNVTATVFIGGGIGSMVTSSAYGDLNATFPKNLLIAIGRQDVLFDLETVEVELADVFRASERVVPGILYGDFSSQTARKFVSPATSHLFEPYDPVVVSEIVSWMTDSLRTGSDQGGASNSGLVYPYREVAVSVGLIAFLGLVFPISAIVFGFVKSAVGGGKSRTKYGVLDDWKVLLVWSVLSLALFLPMFLVGQAVPVPPLIFGSSFAWWLFGVAAVELLVAMFLLPRFSTVRLKLRSAVTGAFTRSGIVVALLLVVLLYLIAYVTELVSSIDMRVVVPMFGSLMPNSRILAFLSFLPFFLVYFFADGLYLHEFRNDSRGNSGLSSSLGSALKVVGIKILPYAVLLAIQYVPLFLLNVRVFPSPLGFLMEFFWGILPLFVISTIYSWWFQRRTNMIGVGVVFDSLLFAWSAAAIFPF